MRLFAKCERCERYAEASHNMSTASAQAQAIMSPTRYCSISPPSQWRLIDERPFCSECASHIQDAINAAMRPPPRSAP